MEHLDVAVVDFVEHVEDEGFFVVIELGEGVEVSLDGAKFEDEFAFGEDACFFCDDVLDLAEVGEDFAVFDLDFRGGFVFDVVVGVSFRNRKAK